MTDFQMGLVISGVGLSITFLVLFILIGVIVIMQKIFPSKSTKENKTSKTVDPTASKLKDFEDSDKSIIAAIAAAVYLRSRRSSQLGASLLAGPGLYRTSRK